MIYVNLLILDSVLEKLRRNNFVRNRLSEECAVQTLEVFLGFVSAEHAQLENVFVLECIRKFFLCIRKFFLCIPAGVMVFELCEE